VHQLAPTSPHRPLELVRQPDLVAQLTPREREVLGLIAEGHDNAAICGRLFIGAKTLERHVQNIFLKLDLPPGGGRHRRVCAVLAYLRSPVSRAALEPVVRATTSRYS
jgi:DNA-binding NarL/FixJ family response regulator